MQGIMHVLYVSPTFWPPQGRPSQASTILVLAHSVKSMSTHLASSSVEAARAARLTKLYKTKHLAHIKKITKTQKCPPGMRKAPRELLRLCNKYINRRGFKKTTFATKIQDDLQLYRIYTFFQRFLTRFRGGVFCQSIPQDGYESLNYSE